MYQVPTLEYNQNWPRLEKIIAYLHVGNHCMLNRSFITTFCISFYSTLDTHISYSKIVSSSCYLKTISIYSLQAMPSDATVPVKLCQVLSESSSCKISST